MRNIGIVGSYGGMNLGDEAILECIIKELRKHLGDLEITVFSRNAQDTLERHKIERAFQVRDMSRAEVIPEIKRLDCLILGGGGILFDSEASIFLREVQLAHEFNIPVITYALGAGPLEDAKAQEIVREALDRMQLITVRERKAQHALEKAGVSHPIEVTADPAFLMQPEAVAPSIIDSYHLNNGSRWIGISVREPGGAAPDLNVDHYHSLVANAADFAIERFDAHALFIPMERSQQDLQHSHAVISKMLCADRSEVMKHNLRPGQILDLMGRFDFVIGMRLHFLIFAALQEVPFVALPYAGKVQGLLDRLGLEAPPVNLVNAGRLLAYIDKSWDERKDLKQRLHQFMPAIKQDAERTGHLVAEAIRRPQWPHSKRKSSRPPNSPHELRP